MGDGSFCGVLLAARASGVVESDDCSGRFDAAIDFRSRGYKTISGQANAGPEQRRGELENIGIAPDGGVSTLGFGSSDEGAHRGTRERNVGVIGGDDHLFVRE